MRHIVSFRTLWMWIAVWILMDLVFMAIGPASLPEGLRFTASPDNLAKDLSTVWFILGVWVFARETAE